MSWRPWVLSAGLAALSPLAAPAQECRVGESGCAAGECPQLPYEEFLGIPDVPAPARSAPLGTLPGAPARRPSLRGGPQDIPPVADRPFDPDSGDRIVVRRFVVDPVTPNPEAGITQESVQAVADAAFARQSGGAEQWPMTVGQMVRVSDEVTTFYRNHGYLVTKAFLPVQALGDDRAVRIQVLEGRVSEVRVENAKDYSESVLSRPSRALIGSTPTRDSVESALLYTSDYPGVRVFGTFRPGAEVGDTQLILQVQNEKPFDFSAGADNFGTEFTGVYRLRGDAAWNNPLGLGDRVNLTLLQSVAPEDTTYGLFTYRAPLGLRGLTGSISAGHNAFAVTGDPFTILQLEGTITTYGAGLDWRFLRYRFINASAGLTVAHKASELTIVGTTTITDDNYDVATLTGGLERIDTRFRGVDTVQFSVRQGIGGEFSTVGSFDTNFTVPELSYQRLQSLAETQFAIIRFAAQHTDKPISPLEQFALAGPDKVRAYPVGQTLRHTGQFASLEYRIQAPGFADSQGPFDRQWRDLLSFSLFADYAHGKSAHVDDGVVLSGAGLGVIFGVPGSFQIQLQGSAPLSSLEANDGDDARFYGNVSVNF